VHHGRRVVHRRRVLHVTEARTPVTAGEVVVVVTPRMREARQGVGRTQHRQSHRAADPPRAVRVRRLRDPWTADDASKHAKKDERFAVSVRTAPLSVVGGSATDGRASGGRPLGVAFHSSNTKPRRRRATAGPAPANARHGRGPLNSDTALRPPPGLRGVPWSLTVAGLIDGRLHRLFK